MSISVVVLGDQEKIVRQIEGYRGELMVTRVCSGIAEAIAACDTGMADVLIVADAQLVPPMEQLDALLMRQTAVVLFFDRPEDWKPLPDVLHLPADSGMAELEGRIRGVVQSLNHSGTNGTLAVPEPEDDSTGRNGRIVSFWSAPGSPGRSTVALNYAVETAAAGKTVVLLDADTYAASIAIQLGLMDESASIAQLCRAIDAGSLDVARLNAACSLVQVGEATMRVATGIPRASRWPEVRASALRRAAMLLKVHYDLVVLDLAPYIELDEQLSFDTQAPQRNAVTVEMLQCSDELFMIVRADSLGIPRALRAIDELEDALPGLNPKIVFNRVGASSTGRSPKRRLIEAWDRFGPTHQIAGYLPEDSAACNAAVLGGSPLLEIAPRGLLRMEIRSLAGINSTDSPKKWNSRRFRSEA
ncbi:CpaE family protein [Glutamicibacter sp. NPDC090743]|uniref:AAA family ATPase n=1 Tax=Glutamicibacter sp. NPDC090743 TaxID=3364001 RepID=UPI003812EEFC